MSCSYFFSDEKTRRSDVRIPKDNSLMVEGHHFGPDEHKQERKASWEQKEISSPSTISLDSGHGSTVTKTKGKFKFSDGLKRSLIKYLYGLEFLPQTNKVPVENNVARLISAIIRNQNRILHPCSV